MEIVSIRQHPEYKDVAIQYFQDKWASRQTLMVYDDCITHCIDAVSSLPQWYLLVEQVFREGSLLREKPLLCEGSLLHEGSFLHEGSLLRENQGEVVGCCGLITNDFISRMDLYPWLCALYIDDACRGRKLGSVLIERVKQDAAMAGFMFLYLATDHIGYYEKYGFNYIGNGYHPWGDTSRIYRSATTPLADHGRGSDAIFSG